MARMAIELVQRKAEEMRDKLVEAVGDDLLKRQGAAQEFKKLYVELTRKPPTQDQPPGVETDAT